MDAGGSRNRGRRLIEEITAQLPDARLAGARAAVHRSDTLVERARLDLEAATSHLPEGRRLQAARAQAATARHDLEARAQELVADVAARIVVACVAEPPTARIEMLLGLVDAVQTPASVESIAVALSDLAERLGDPLLPLGPLSYLAGRVSLGPQMEPSSLISASETVRAALLQSEADQPFRMGEATTNVCLTRAVHFRRVWVGRDVYQVAQTTRARTTLGDGPGIDFQPVLAVRVVGDVVAVAPLIEGRAFLTAHGVKEQLRSLDGSPAGAVALLSGLRPERIEELGGLG